jgi:hypothetical protein
MIRSESIKELATALAKAQGELAAAKKNKTNPHFKSQYADLAAIWDAAREVLPANGLSVAQLPTPSERNEVLLDTMLMHSSGEWICSTISIPVGKADAQGHGSALSYARRYALAAIVGIAVDDDDGNAASRQSPEFDMAPHIDAINKALSIVELKAAWEAASKAAQEVGARSEYSALKNRVTERKKEIAPLESAS